MEVICLNIAKLMMLKTIIIIVFTILIVAQANYPSSSPYHSPIIPPKFDLSHNIPHEFLLHYLSSSSIEHDDNKNRIQYFARIREYVACVYSAKKKCIKPTNKDSKAQTVDVHCLQLESETCRDTLSKAINH